MRCRHHVFEAEELVMIGGLLLEHVEGGTCDMAGSERLIEGFLYHLPAWVEALASGIWRASAIMSESACSAVVTALPKGVFMTTMPRWVAAGISTLSTPMPARPMTLRLAAALMSLGDTLVAERMASPS